MLSSKKLHHSAPVPSKAQNDSKWRTRLVLTLAALLVGWAVLAWLIRWVAGEALYFYEYFLAVTFHTRPLVGCKYSRVTSSQVAWSTLSTEHWLERRRCKGNFDGRGAQGELLATLAGYLGKLLVPTGLFGYLTLFTTLSIIASYAWPQIQTMKAQADAKGITMLGAATNIALDAISACASYAATDVGFTIFASLALTSLYIFRPVVFVLGFNLWAFCVATLIPPALHFFEIGSDAPLTQTFDHWSRTAKIFSLESLDESFAAAIVASGIIVFTVLPEALFAWNLSTIILFATGRLVAMWTRMCRHVIDCDCHIGYISEAQVQTEYVKIGAFQALQAFRDEANKRCYHLQDEGCSCHNTCESELRESRRAHRLAVQAIQTGGGNPIGGGGSQNEIFEEQIGKMERENGDLRRFIVNLKDQLQRANPSVDERRYQETIKSLKADLQYAKRLSIPERRATSETISKAQALTETRDKEISKLEAHIRWMKGMQSEKADKHACDDKEVCEKEKAEWGKELAKSKAQLSQHANYVQEACRSLGWQDDIVPYVDVKDYISQSVLLFLNYARQHPQRHGTEVAKKVTSQYIETLEKQHQDYRRYFGKLEMELSRLGGNPQELRMGGQTFMAHVFKKISYMDFRSVIFSQYETLHTKINALSNLILTWHLPVPEWDLVTHDYGLPSPEEDPLFSPEFGPDYLAGRLVQNELIRLLNHLSKLTHFVRIQHDTVGRLGPTDLHKSTEAIWNQQNTGANQIMFDTYELMEKCAVEYPKSRRLEGTTAQRRYPIWVEMFRMIQFLDHVILQFSRLRSNTPPKPSFQALPHMISFPRKTYDILVNDLTKYEISTLYHHILLQLDYMTALMLPGTENGMMELPDTWRGPDEERTFIRTTIQIIGRAKRLIDFWNVDPKPGSIANLEFPDYTMDSGVDEKNNEYKGKDNKNDWDSIKWKIESLKKALEAKKDRIRQLEKFSKKNVKTQTLQVKGYSGNFTGQPKGTSEEARYKVEISELQTKIKEYEGWITQRTRVGLPKWPNKGGPRFF